MVPVAVPALPVTLEVAGVPNITPTAVDVTEAPDVPARCGLVIPMVAGATPVLRRPTITLFMPNLARICAKITVESAVMSAPDVSKVTFAVACKGQNKIMALKSNAIISLILLLAFEPKN